ncbi:hypothetical protein PSECIP111951_00014 [Pseudoalteromonas holothuriae]|uniref:Secreted protein n=1 Tax=Pseudoalteromonas holothuriae TaxID=2963714 RepID=A0ABN8UFA7_9GAMM|nr:hypothetical protein [Pseudoalteromonas sp. CIP111951]CAH9049731.1 hypothetical protein PSECIP111951_00014 [Pseudoalteromonas sp. CIP111951]
MSKTKIIITLLFVAFISTVFYFVTLQAEPSNSVELNNQTKNTDTTSQPPTAFNEASTELNVVESNHSLSCDAYENALDKARLIHFNLIGAKAIGWYFEGIDKYKIAHTLAKMYGYQNAMIWIEQVNALSHYYEKSQTLIQDIHGLEYSALSGSNRRYLQSLSTYKVPTYKDHFDVNKALNLYPDIALKLWLAALTKALENTDLQQSLYAISQLNSLHKNDLFFEHPLRDRSNIFLLSTFSQPQVKQLLTAMFELAPVYLEPQHGSSANSVKQSLMALDKSELTWRFRTAFVQLFEIDPDVNRRINTLAKRYTELNVELKAQDYCEPQTTNLSITAKQIGSNNIKNKLSKHRQVIGGYLCPDKNIFYGYTVVSAKLKKYGIDFEALNSFAAIMSNRSKLQAALLHFDEYEAEVLFDIMYARTSYNNQQIKTLIEHKLVPQSSSFYTMLYRLPIDEQKALLVEQQFNIQNSNSLGLSLITQVLEKSLRQGSADADKLVPFLISQGVPLTSSEQDLDPLWFKLYSLNNYEDPTAELPVNVLASLIEHTKLNDTHIDALYKIKQKNVQLYHQLIEQFPELRFTEPSELIKINCMAQ